MMKNCGRSNLGGKGLFSVCFHITVHHQRELGQEITQGRDLAVADTEAMEECAY